MDSRFRRRSAALLALALALCTVIAAQAGELKVMTSGAFTAPCDSYARMPKKMALGEYQTRMSVESSAGRASTGEYWENPVSSAASDQTGSSSTPSIRTSASWMRGAWALVSP